jgi:hypothetical protein
MFAERNLTQHGLIEHNLGNTSHMRKINNKSEKDKPKRVMTLI